MKTIQKHRKIIGYLTVVLSLILTYVALSSTGGLKFNLGGGGDDYSYMIPIFDDFRHYLGGHRTLGYPLFLHSYFKLFNTYETLPHFCFIFFAAAIIYLYSNLNLFFDSEWSSLLVCLGLIYGGFSFSYHLVTTESIVSGVLVFVFAATLNLIRKPSIGSIITLSVVIFLAWNIRPSLIVLILVVPLSIVFSIFIGRTRISRRILLFLAFGLLAPLVIFITVRYVLVGHVGITSFTAFGLSSHATTLLTAEDIDNLSITRRTTAERILKNKESIFDECQAFHASKRRFERTIACANEMGMISWLVVIEETKGVTPIPQLGAISNPWVFTDYLPLGSLTYFFTTHHDPMVEERLMGYAKEVLRIKYLEYVKWIFTAFLDFVKKVISDLFVVIALGAFLAHFYKRSYIDRSLVHRSLVNMTIIAAFSFLFYSASYLLTVFIYVPLPRYNQVSELYWNAFILVSPFYFALLARFGFEFRDK